MRFDKDQLLSITIKPTKKCNANCSFCRQRMAHYKGGLQHEVSLTKWVETIDEAASLGVAKINISGGEPTLYPQLFDLIKACKDRGLEVHLKTNAFIIDEIFAKKLASLGLNSCTVSIYSHDFNIHDDIKGIKGSHQKAENAIKQMIDQGIDVNIQTVLTKQMLKSFDSYLDWATTFDIGCLFISYIEGNDASFLPTKDEIYYFKKEIVKKCKFILANKFREEPLLLKENLNRLENLFNFQNVDISQIANGIYNQNLAGCGRNYSMAILLSDGEIHPCNAVEYFHCPVVGNILDGGLIKAWVSRTWDEVKKNGTPWCNVCPMNRHTFIVFKGESDPSSFYATPLEKVKNEKS